MSFCRVYENLWVGDAEAALRVAQNETTNPRFAAVFNASSCERYGISFEDDYSAQGIRYATLAKKGEPAGVLLADSPTRPPPDPERYNGGIVHLKLRGEPLAVYGNTFASGAIFRYYMRRASDKIHKLRQLVGENGQILVHCMGGVNRSNACVASYLILRQRFAPDKACDLVKNNNAQNRNVRVLTNEDFVRELGSAELRLPKETLRAAAEVAMTEIGRATPSSSIAAPAPTAGVIVRAAKKCVGYACCVCGSADPLELACCEFCGPDAIYCSRRCQEIDAPTHDFVCRKKP